MAHHSPVDQYNYAPPNQPYLGTPPNGIPAAQPVYVLPGEQGKSGKWSAGLLECFGDCGVCCLGYFLPCVLYGQNVEMLTGESCCAPCCLYFLLSAVGCCACFACGTRERLRKKYGLPASPCNDCCVHCFCCVCALCQEAREMRIQADKQKHITAYITPHMAPPQQAMHY